MEHLLIVELYLKSLKFNSSVIELVLNKYQEPTRFYHNISHIAKLLIQFRYSDDWLSLTHLQRQKVILAILFHDVIYEVGSKTNEEDSVDFLRQCNFFGSSTDLNKQTWSNIIIDEVAELILSTKDHIPTGQLSKILIDLDLSSFNQQDFKDVLKDSILVETELMPKFSMNEIERKQISFLTLYKDRVTTDLAKFNIESLIRYYQMDATTRLLLHKWE